MSGGIAITLALILLIVGGGIGIFMYLTGGAIGASRKRGGDSERPEHTHPTTPMHENTRFVGTKREHDAERVAEAERADR